MLLGFHAGQLGVLSPVGMCGPVNSSLGPGEFFITFKGGQY